MVRARMAAGEDLYTLDEGALRTIDPDLVVTQDLCAVCAVDISEVDQALAHLGCRAEVLTLDPMTLDEVLASIEAVGRATGTLERASDAGAVAPAAARRCRPGRRHPPPPPRRRPGMDRPAVLLGALGAGHGHGGRRRIGPRIGGRTFEEHRVARCQRGAAGPDRGRPLRVPARRRDESWPSRSWRPACCPRAFPSGRSTPMPPSCGPDRGWSMASRPWRPSHTPAWSTAPPGMAAPVRGAPVRTYVLAGDRRHTPQRRSAVGVRARRGRPRDSVAISTRTAPSVLG